MFIYLLCCARVLKTVSALAAECFLSISDEKCLIFFHFYVNSSYEMVCASVQCMARCDRKSRSRPEVKKAHKKCWAGGWAGHR